MRPLTNREKQRRQPECNAAQMQGYYGKAYSNGPIAVYCPG